MGHDGVKSMRQISTVALAAFAVVGLVLVLTRRDRPRIGGTCRRPDLPCAAHAVGRSRSRRQVARQPCVRHSAAACGVARHARHAQRRGIRRAPGAGRTPEGSRPRRLRFRSPERPLRSGRWGAVAAAALVRTVRAAAPGVVDRRSAERPPAGAHAGRAEARRRAARARDRRLGLVHRLHPDRALHHARPHRLGPARRLQQRERDRAVARLRDDRQRDDPRIAHRAARRPAAPGSGDSKPTWATRAATGTATRWSSRPRTSSIGRA